jgi:hypothetical protein
MRTPHRRSRRFRERNSISGGTACTITTSDCGRGSSTGGTYSTSVVRCVHCLGGGGGLEAGAVGAMATAMIPTAEVASDGGGGGDPSPCRGRSRRGGGEEGGGGTTTTTTTTATEARNVLGVKGGGGASRGCRGGWGDCARRCPPRRRRRGTATMEREGTTQGDVGRLRAAAATLPPGRHRMAKGELPARRIRGAGGCASAAGGTAAAAAAVPVPVRPMIMER